MTEHTGKELKGHKIAFLARRGVEEPELTAPWKAIEAAGGEPVLVSNEPGTITALVGDWDKSGTYDVDVVAEDANADDYLGLVLPGGTLNSDKIRDDEASQKFVHAFMAAGKPVAPICHGAWILVETGDVEGRTMTSTPRIRTDLKNAGATWVDEEFHRDGNLMSSRSPRDLDAFNKGIVEAFIEAANK